MSFYDPGVNTEDQRLAPTKDRKKSRYVSGICRYYQTFIPQYSALTNWLNGIKMAKKFLWNKEVEQDFIELKKAFTQGKIQALPDFRVVYQLILTTDWSKENIPGCYLKYRMDMRDSLDVWEGSVINMSRIIPVTRGSC